MKIAVIGAGIAGLLATKHSKAAGFEVVCFEQTDSIGGTWVYDENIKLDRHGRQMYSSMYKNLRTNLPKEIMGFNDYPFTGPNKSFVSWSEVLDFLKRFADDFKLEENILFNYQVKRVAPCSGVTGQWDIIAENLKSDEVHHGIYDAVFICVGKYWHPNLPKPRGEEYFKGKIIHRAKYRKPDVFKDQRVLVVGCGPSGLDIANDVATKADHVYLSHHTEKTFDGIFPVNVSFKPDILEITERGTIQFRDESEVSVDSIIFCTSYRYYYQCLSPDCKIKVDGYHVQKLYKHLVNIEYPTMFILGIVFPTIITFLLDVQVSFNISLHFVFH